MFTNLFLNFMSAPASSGGITLNLQSFNASANVNLTLSATGLTAGLAPDSCAITAINQLNTQLTQYGIQYSVPQITGEIPGALFRLSRTEHIINFFSECQFDLTLDSNDTGASISVTREPLLVTLDKFTTMFGLIKGGATLSTDEKLLLIETISGMITAYCNNNFAIAGYVQSWNGFYQRSFFLNLGLPVQSFDPPRLAPPILGLGIQWYLWYLVYPWIRWNLVPETGELFFQPNNNIINSFEPGSLNNQIKISYVAGEWKLPAQLLLCFTQLAKTILNDPMGVASLKTGSFQVQFRNKTPIETALALLDDYVI